MTGDGERDTRRKRMEWESQPQVDDQSLVSIAIIMNVNCIHQSFCLNSHLEDQGVELLEELTLENYRHPL